MSDRRLILVLGMHRSGTSVMTRALNVLGAAVGTDLLQPQKEVNARGFWEHRELVAINEALLLALQRNWYDFRPLPEGWWKRQDIGALKKRATDFLERAFSDAGLVVLKDPRLCLLLPLWKEVARNLGWNLSAVLAVRAPWEVVASLLRRDPLGDITGNLLWLRYTCEAERNTRDMPRGCLDYGVFLADWKNRLQMLAHELNLEWPNDLESVTGVLAGEIDSGLRHQQSEFRSAAMGIASLAGKLYHQLSAGMLNEESLDALEQEFEELLKHCPDMLPELAETNTRLLGINNELQELGKMHQHALDTIADKDRQLETLASEFNHAQQVVRQRDEAVRNCEETRARQEHRITSMEHKITSLGADLEYARSVVEERDRQLDKLAGELEHAGAVVKERDRQLKQLQAVMAHPAVRVMRRLFSLDEQ